MGELEKYLLKLNNTLVTPVQPLMVFASSKYYKMTYMKYGISHFYRFKVSEEIISNVQVVPDGCVDIVFHLKGNKPKAVCYGSPLEVHDSGYIDGLENGSEIFGVRFLPNNIVMPGGYGIFEFTNNKVDLSQIIDNSSEIIDLICESDDFNTQVSIFLKYYLSELQKLYTMTTKNHITCYMIDEIIKSKGAIRIEKLSENVGYSPRYINKIFNENLGMSPKMFCKIMRFQGILSELTRKQKLTDIADIMGFFDQSHLAKEFKQFIGITPKRFEEVISTEEYKNRIIVVK